MKVRNTEAIISQEFVCLQAASDWEMQVDLGGKLVVRQEIVCTSLRANIVLWSVIG